MLELIHGSQIPLSASEIHALLEKRFDLATVYRGLTYFEKHGLVESFSFSCSQEGTERYYYQHSTPHTHFFHCSSCHQFIPLGTCRLQELEAQLEQEHDVVIKEHTLYFTGLCSPCRKQQAIDG